MECARPRVISEYAIVIAFRIGWKGLLENRNIVSARVSVTVGVEVTTPSRISTAYGRIEVNIK